MTGHPLEQIFWHRTFFLTTQIPPTMCSSGLGSWDSVILRSESTAARKTSYVRKSVPDDARLKGKRIVCQEIFPMDGRLPYFRARVCIPRKWIWGERIQLGENWNVFVFKAKRIGNQASLLCQEIGSKWCSVLLANVFYVRKLVPRVSLGWMNLGWKKQHPIV